MGIFFKLLTSQGLILIIQKFKLGKFICVVICSNIWTLQSVFVFGNANTIKVVIIITVNFICFYFYTMMTKSYFIWILYYPSLFFLRRKSEHQVWCRAGPCGAPRHEGLFVPHFLQARLQTSGPKFQRAEQLLIKEEAARKPSEARLTDQIISPRLGGWSPKTLHTPCSCQQPHHFETLQKKKYKSLTALILFSYSSPDYITSQEVGGGTEQFLRR